MFPAREAQSLSDCVQSARYAANALLVSFSILLPHISQIHSECKLIPADLAQVRISFALRFPSLRCAGTRR